MRLWELSGIEAEIPQVLMGPLEQGKWLDKMEKLRRATGFFFSQVERGNRKHAFFSALEKFKGLPEAEMIEKAIIDCNCDPESIECYMFESDPATEYYSCHGQPLFKFMVRHCAGRITFKIEPITEITLDLTPKESKI